MIADDVDAVAARLHELRGGRPKPEPKVEQQPYFPVPLELPDKFAPLFLPARYKVFYGSRGGAKSVSFARALIAKAHTEKILVLCAREYQNSILDSVLRTLATEIAELGLLEWFEILSTTIRHKLTGSQFLFKGLHNNIAEIKSMSGINICWIEEAQSCPEMSWLTIDPTIREENSELWISFNPVNEEDATYKRFVLNPPDNAIVVKVGWEDNPWFPEVLEKQRVAMLHSDPDAYDWVWGGNTTHNSEATIFRKKYQIENFETPDDARFMHGIDWGFAADPTVMVRCWVRELPDGSGSDLMIDREVYGQGVEIDQLPTLFDWIDGDPSLLPAGKEPSSRMWPLKADSARPETISYIKGKGFNIYPAEKWPGSLEDGIAHLKGFNRIIVHENNCKHTAQEFRLYSFKVDRNNDILPIIVDKHNHCIDALRYALDGFIQRRAGVGAWARLIKHK